MINARHALRRIRRSDDGAALVEFAIVLPILVVMFAVIVEGSRTFWSYQAAISGVRDATRWISRVVPRDVCALGGFSSSFDQDELKAIVAGDNLGDTVLAPSVTVNSVTATSNCVTWKDGEVAIATVTADLTVDYPFGGLFTLMGGDLVSAKAIVSDQARIFGE